MIFMLLFTLFVTLIFAVIILAMCIHSAAFHKGISFWEEIRNRIKGTEE